MRAQPLAAALALALLTTAVACDDDATPPAVDGGGDSMTNDLGSGLDATQDAQPGDDGSVANAREYVISALHLPLTQADVDATGYDHDGDSSADNGLGAIFLAIDAAVSGMDLQGELTQNLHNGKIVLLMRLAADSFSDATASMQVWTGAEASCCSAKPCSATDAQQSCFSGSHSFTVDSTSPQNAVLQGSITGGALSAGPGEMEMLVPIGKYPVKVTLRQARVQATVTTDGLVSGILNGVVNKDEIDSKVVPSVAQVLDGELNDPTTKQTVKDAITSVFDADKDGTISSTEVAENALIKLLLAGDVDTDNDSVKELSLGIGFSAVGCVIAP